MLVIVDYGLGNLRSILNKFRRLKIDAILSSDKNDILNADKLILPGVGYFAAGMKNLREYGLIEPLSMKVLEEKTPILGICLGMQLFADFSEEGDTKGLGWVEAEIKKFNFEDFSPKLKIPHVGWNTISVKNEAPFFKDLEEESRYYFTHSYFFDCQNKDDCGAVTQYGKSFTSVVIKDNIYGTQFHPEKSHRYGVKLIENFVNFS